MTDIGRGAIEARRPDFLHRLIAAAIVSGQRLRALHGVWKARREITRLSELDDRMLKDIGVQRADIDWAYLQPWSVDPTQVLAERVSRRRASALWVRRLRQAGENRAADPLNRPACAAYEQ